MNEGGRKAALVLVSAKIPGDLFDELEDIRRELRMETRTEIVNRALCFYAAAVRTAMNGMMNEIAAEGMGKEVEN